MWSLTWGKLMAHSSSGAGDVAHTQSLSQGPFSCNVGAVTIKPPL